MALSSEPADRCRAASLTMTVLAFITALALMVVGFASPSRSASQPFEMRSSYGDGIPSSRNFSWRATKDWRAHAE